MQLNIRNEAFHVELVKELFRKPLGDQSTLCLMLLLHACTLRLSEEARVAGGVAVFEGITSRRAAEVVASLFSSGEESQLAHWYWRWNSDWNAHARLEDAPAGFLNAYAVLENLPDRLICTLRRLRDVIESHPWAERLEDDEWDLIRRLQGT